MAFFGLLVLVGVALLVWWLVRAASQGGGQGYGAGQTRDDAYEAARRRYASGEISREEYDDIVRTLRG